MRVWVFLGLLPACGSSVTILSDKDGPAPPGIEPQQPCEERAQPVEIRDPIDGSFTGDRLHLQASVDGQRSYVVLELEGSGAGALPQWVVLPTELEGSARLADLGDDRHVRLHADNLDVVDGGGVLLESGPLPSPPTSDAFSVDAGLLYYCAGTPPTLQAIDVDQPDATTSVDEWPCRAENDGFAAHARSWISWRADDAMVHAHVVTGFSASASVSFGFAIDGIHQYGPIVSGATDGERIVIDPENDDWFLVFDAAKDLSGGPYVGFGAAADKRLLGVHDALAYFATPGGVVAYDVNEVNAVTRWDAVAEGDLEPDETRLIAAGRDHIAITDGRGRLLLAPSDLSSALTEVSAFDEPLSCP